MVVVSSVYAFANGFGNTPYAVAKAGVESLGRALRVELAPHGASATVAYFGWVDTKLVQDAFAQPDADRVRDLSPDFLLKRITPHEAGAGLVRGIEERAPRVFVPEVVALRLRPARHRQPPARPPHGERRQDPGADPRPRRGGRRGRELKPDLSRLARSTRLERRRDLGHGDKGSPVLCRLRSARRSWRPHHRFGADESRRDPEAARRHRRSRAGRTDRHRRSVHRRSGDEPHSHCSTPPRLHVEWSACPRMVATLTAAARSGTRAMEVLASLSMLCRPEEEHHPRAQPRTST